MARCFGVVLGLFLIGLSGPGAAQGGDGLAPPPQPAQPAPPPRTPDSQPGLEPASPSTPATSTPAADGQLADADPEESAPPHEESAQLEESTQSGVQPVPSAPIPPAPSGYAAGAQQPAPYAGPPRYGRPPTFQPPVDRRYRRGRRPHFVSYTEGDPVPRGMRLEDRRNRKLIIAGVAAFGGSYLASLIVAASYDDTLPWAIPFVGSIIWYADRGDRDLLLPTLLVSLAQTAGVILFGLGMVKHRYVRVPAQYEVSITPIVSATQVGLSLTVF